MFDQILDWETPTQKRQVGLDLKTHLRRLLAFTFLDVFFKYANSNESLTTAGVWSEAGVFEQQLQEVSNSSAVAVEVGEAGPGCRIEDRCSVSVSASIVNHNSRVRKSGIPKRYKLL